MTPEHREELLRFIRKGYEGRQCTVQALCIIALELERIADCCEMFETKLPPLMADIPNPDHCPYSDAELESFRFKQPAPNKE